MINTPQLSQGKDTYAANIDKFLTSFYHIYFYADCVIPLTKATLFCGKFNGTWYHPDFVEQAGGRQGADRGTGTCLVQIQLAPVS